MSEQGLRLCGPAPWEVPLMHAVPSPQGGWAGGHGEAGGGPLSPQLSKRHLSQTSSLAFHYTQNTRGTGYPQHKQLFVCCLCLFVGI